MAQQDVCDYFKKKPNRFYPMSDIHKETNVARGSLCSNLRRMFDSGFLERKLVPNPNKHSATKEYAYRIKR